MPPGRSELIDSSCLHRLLLWPLQASKTTSTWTRDKCRDIPCGSPPEDDQVVRRCLLTISAFCSRLRGVVLVFIALFGPIRWCWRDTRVGALIRLCGQVICTLSAVLVLVCLPAYGVQEIGSVSLSSIRLVRKWLPFDLLRDDFRKLSSYSRQSTEPF